MLYVIVEHRYALPSLEEVREGLHGVRAALRADLRGNTTANINALAPEELLRDRK